MTSRRATYLMATFLRSAHRDQRGTVLVPFALMSVLLCGMIGAGVDYGRWLHARSVTLSAMDAAVLAGARSLQVDNSDLNGALAAAQKFYTENISGRSDVVNDTISFSVGSDKKSFRSSGNAYVTTPLLGLINIDKLPLLSEAGAEFAEAKISVGGNSNTNTEISMMLDITGSMAGSKVVDMKAAATDLIDIVLPDGATENSVKVAIVPFSSVVRLPSSALTAARGNPSATTMISGWRYNRTPCVVERKGTNRYTDAAPSSGDYVMAEYDPYSSNCVLNTNAEVLPLTNTKATLKSKISGLSVNGYTAGHLGTAWAWYTLSPNWNSLWPSSGAADYDTTKVNKIAILMTDGEYNTQYDTSGANTGYTGRAAANDTSTNQARALCTSMKAKGITVYTVGFQLGWNTPATTTLNQCATDAGKAYTADNGDQLKQAFRDIALKISSLHLSK